MCLSSLIALLFTAIGNLPLSLFYQLTNEIVYISIPDDGRNPGALIIMSIIYIYIESKHFNEAKIH